MTGSERQDLIDRVRRGDLDPSTAAGRILTRLATLSKALEIHDVSEAAPEVESRHVALSPDNWPRLKDVFAGARALPTGEHRHVYLVEACGGNEALRQELESLLVSDERATSFLEQPAMAPVDEATVTRSLEGQRIGPYQIASRIGVGGMGEVYRARDTKLNRQVAIKVLLPAVADDPDRLERFSREAQVLASLNHPHIAQIHGLEDADGVRALVMELVEGPTLADRIARGAIPVDEALPIARQLTEALDAAHEQGIIHRDLKPANIKVRGDGTAKVLDFGLAKALDAPGSESVDLMSSPPLTAHGTGAGLVLGTAAYMSPEQARGKAVDRRADFWAFGCVLYEILTQRPAFAGDSLTDVMAAVVTSEPDWTRLPAETPAAIRTLLRRCLEKDVTRRLDSGAAARLEIDNALAAPSAGTPVRAATPSLRGALLAMTALACVALVTAIVARMVMGPGPEAPVQASRFAIVTPPAQPLNVSGDDRDLALSPDGRRLVYRAGGSVSAGGPLMVRSIGQLDARPLAGITNAYAPFFSPDGQWIGFFEKGEIKKVSTAGGPAITLGPFAGATLGASWGEDDTIVFGTGDPNTGLWRVPAAGGPPVLLTTPDTGRGEGDHGFPSVLPGGRFVLFTIAAEGRTDTSQVVALDLETGERKTLIRGGSQADYIDASEGSRQDGYLVYATARTLRAVRFDPVRLDVLGDPVTVVEQVMMKPSGAANYAVSRAGTLVHMPGGPVEQEPLRSLVWVDRKGHEEPTGAPLRSYGPPRISPDGAHVAIGILDQGNTEIFIWDLARQTLRRLTFSPGMDGMAHWTRDGRRIVFMSARSGVPNVYMQLADGTGTVDRLATSAHARWPTATTPDGTAVVGFELAPGEATGVISFPLASPASRPGRGVSPSRVEPLVESLFEGDHPDISPDGRYLAYESDESGRTEVYVRPFPEVHRGRWQISTKGGTRPAWARNGRELFYIDSSMALTGVSVRTTGPTFSVGTPAKVFDTTYAQPNPARHYDVSPDGERFLMVKDIPTGDPNATPASMVVVEHWFEELKARVR